MIPISQDSVYHGRVKLLQPETGFRAGTDALLLAAALRLGPGEQAAEFGCGVGGALLPAAFRCTAGHFTGVEQDSILADLARGGIVANGFETRVSVATADIADWVKTRENQFDLVFANPPYFEAGRISAPGAGKAGAYIETLGLADWLKAMAFAARPRAPMVVIHRAAELARLLTTLERIGGEITVLPIAPKPGDPARRVLVRARKGLRRGPVNLLAPLVLHDTNGPSAALEAVQRGDAIIW
jgi:tRNA1(Val) A37 N6-methylase TrmN6